MGSMINQICYIAMGCSWRGNLTKRDGKLVTCGHHHRLRLDAKRCCDQMQKEKPGRCQDYRVFKVNLKATS